MTVVAADDNGTRFVTERTKKQVKDGFTGLRENDHRLVLFCAQILNEVDRTGVTAGCGDLQVEIRFFVTG